MFNEETKTGAGEGEGGGGDGGGGSQTDPRDEAIAKLTEQVGNLTKGIAGYRDEAQAATAAAKEAKEAAEAATKKATVPDVPLDPKKEAELQAWAEKQGFVSKEELAAERVRIAADASKHVQQTAVSEFLEKHPEYDDDEKWNALDEEFKLYKTPADINGYRKLLEKIHKDLGGGGSDTDRARAEAKAELAKRSRLNLGGRGGGGSDIGNDADVDKLMAKYPNLSRDQIVARLAEVDALYPKK